MIVNDCTHLAHIEMVISFTLSYFILVFAKWLENIEQFCCLNPHFWLLKSQVFQVETSQRGLSQLEVSGGEGLRGRRGIIPKMLQIFLGF